MTTFLLLVTFLLEMVWMLWGEIHPWSLLGVKGLIMNLSLLIFWKVIEEKRHLQFCHMYLVRQHNERVWHQLHPSHLQRTVLFPSIQKNRKFKKLKSVEDHTCSCNFPYSKIWINRYKKKRGASPLDSQNLLIQIQ